MKLSRDEFVQLSLLELDAVDRVARNLTRDGAEADDLVQETFLRALRAHGEFDLQSFGIRPWLLRILHNTHVNRATREGRRPKPLDAQVLDAMSAPDRLQESAPAAHVGRFDDDELNRAFDRLPSDLRTILLLWAVDELSYKEMAEVLDVPIGTVMSRLHRARQRLYELMPARANMALRTNDGIANGSVSSGPP